MVEDHCYVAKDYIAELQRFQTDTQFAQENTVIEQLPYAPQAVAPSAEEMQKKLTARKEQGKRLSELAAQRRSEKTTAAPAPSPVPDTPASTGPETEADLEVPPLLNVPDDQLNAEQVCIGIDYISLGYLIHVKLKEKRKQVFLYNTAKGRLRAKLKRDEEKARQDLQQKVLQEQYEADPQQFVHGLHERRRAIIDKRARRQKLKAQTIGRRSVAAQEKMRLLAKVIGKLIFLCIYLLQSMLDPSEANDSKRKNKGAAKKKDQSTEDDFGARDDDWDIYRSLVRDLVSLTLSHVDCSKKMKISMKKAKKNEHDLEKLKDYLLNLIKPSNNNNKWQRNKALRNSQLRISKFILELSVFEPQK